MHTIQKVFSNLKAAHRQWRHPGHCSFVHGENWTVILTLQARVLDEKKFVLDFSDLKDVRDFLERNFDHTLLLDLDDPMFEKFEALASTGAIRVNWIPSASAEGIAEFIWLNISPMIELKTHNRVSLVCVEVKEDEKNSATYRP